VAAEVPSAVADIIRAEGLYLPSSGYTSTA
jgi:hypothetical protein